jgi:hypothetical protein
MQLRGNSRIISDEPLEVKEVTLDITDKDYLDDAISGIQQIVSEELVELGLIEIEVSGENIENLTEMLSPFTSFLLGRLVTLMDLKRELYSEDRMLPWVKKPKNN